MTEYIVLYRINSIMSPLDRPFAFRCRADDVDHAEEQCVDAYPDSDVVWVTDITNLDGAYDDYYYGLGDEP